MAKGLKTLDHGMLLRSKSIMDNAMGELESLKELIPECLHRKYYEIIYQFEHALVECDVADQYIENPDWEGA